MPPPPPTGAGDAAGGGDNHDEEEEAGDWSPMLLQEISDDEKDLVEDEEADMEELHALRKAVMAQESSQVILSSKIHLGWCCESLTISIE